MPAKDNILVARDDRLVINNRSKTNVGLSIANARNDELIARVFNIIDVDDKLTIVNNKLVNINDRSITFISKPIDIRYSMRMDNNIVNNIEDTLDPGSSNGPNMDLIIYNILAINGK